MKSAQEPPIPTLSFCTLNHYLPKKKSIKNQQSKSRRRRRPCPQAAKWSVRTPKWCGGNQRRKSLDEMNPENERRKRRRLIDPNPNKNPSIQPWVRRILAQILPTPLACWQRWMTREGRVRFREFTKRFNFICLSKKNVGKWTRKLKILNP